MARMLPKVHINGKTYFIDERLHELRNVDNPMDLLRFETDGDMTVFLGQHAEWITEVRWQDLEPGIDVLPDQFHS
jgi:hypothetical protein